MCFVEDLLFCFCGGVFGLFVARCSVRVCTITAFLVEDGVAYRECVVIVTLFLLGGVC